MIDKDEYPQTAELETRCVDILCPGSGTPENPHRKRRAARRPGRARRPCLGGLALKRRWRQAAPCGGPPRRPAQSRHGRQRTDLLGQVRRLLRHRTPLRADGGRSISPEPRRPAVERCDENTIGVVAVRGSTYDGSYEPVADIAAALDDLPGPAPDSTCRSTWTAPPGAMIAPFLDPDLHWDFRVPRVASINTSGHKYGLGDAGGGLGARGRDPPSALPDDLVFRVNYLGGDMPDLRAELLPAGRPGGRAVLQLPAVGLRRLPPGAADLPGTWRPGWPGEIAGLDHFELLTDGGEAPGVRLSGHVRRVDGFTVFDVSAGLRERGWLVPAYTFPENRTDLAVLRIVVRNGFKPRPGRSARRRPASGSCRGSRSSRRRSTTWRAGARSRTSERVGRTPCFDRPARRRRRSPSALEPLRSRPYARAALVARRDPRRRRSRSIALRLPGPGRRSSSKCLLTRRCRATSVPGRDAGRGGRCRWLVLAGLLDRADHPPPARRPPATRPPIGLHAGGRAPRPIEDLPGSRRSWPPWRRSASARCSGPEAPLIFIGGGLGSPGDAAAEARRARSRPLAVTGAGRQLRGHQHAAGVADHRGVLADGGVRAGRLGRWAWCCCPGAAGLRG